VPLAAASVGLGAEYFACLSVNEECLISNMDAPEAKPDIEQEKR
jgi:hypothetical protein